MARKRSRSDQADGTVQQEHTQDEPQRHEQPAARRTGMADIARRRAAHFAHFNDDATEAAEGNVHVGSHEARTLGPWSSAVELVNARQAAAEQRTKQLQATQEQQAAADVQWAPSRDPALGPRSPCAVKPLFQLALNLLVTHVDAVTSLWGVPDTIRTALATAVCARRRMTPDVAKLFGSDWTSELVVPDCTQLDPKAMVELLQLVLAIDEQQQQQAAGIAEPQQQQRCRLERLELGFCGRGLTDKAAAVVADEKAAGCLHQLRVLRLTGAYALSDTALLSVVRAAPQLLELAVPSASRLTDAFLSGLPVATAHLSVLDLADCRGLSGAGIAALLQQLKHITRLKLDGIAEVDAAVLSAAAQCPSLRALSTAMCPAVDDAALTAFAALSRPPTPLSRGADLSSSCGAHSAHSAHSALEELILDECTAVGDAGLLAVVGVCKSLRVLSLRRCARLTEASLLPAVERGTLEVLSLNGIHSVGSGVIQALGRSCREVLRELDVSFCRDVAEGALGQLLDQCEKLEQLKVYGCSQVTARLVQGHSNARVAVLGISTSANTV